MLLGGLSKIGKHIEKAHMADTEDERSEDDGKKVEAYFCNKCHKQITGMIKMICEYFLGYCNLRF